MILHMVLSLTWTKIILDYLPLQSHHGKDKNIQVHVNLLVLMPKLKYKLLNTYSTLKMFKIIFKFLLIPNEICLMFFMSLMPLLTELIPSSLSFVSSIKCVIYIKLTGYCSLSSISQCSQELHHCQTLLSNNHSNQPHYFYYSLYTLNI